MARGKTVRASSKRSGQSKTTTTSNRPELFPETDYYLPPGTLLDNGKYEILGVLGSPGGFGITYKARWLSIDRIVAIKEFFVSNNNLCSRSSSGFQIVAREPEEYEKMKKKFLDEARFLFDLKHKYIVKIFDFFEENNTAYLVMEYLEGPRLKDLIEEKDKLEYREAEDLIRKIADALIYIHQNGIIHRDISPENIVFRDKSCQEPVLIDFGLAKEYTAERTRSVTAVRDGFAPLESYSANAKKGPYTDIYSLGAILYYILLGEEPPNANDIVLGLPLSFPDWLDQRYVNVISKAMETRVEKRFSSVKDFILALEGYKLAEDKKNKAGYKRKSKEVFAFQSKLILIKKEDRIKFQQKFEGKDLKKVLFGVIDNGQIEEVVWLLEQGVDVNIKYYGITPLHKAVQNNRLEIIEILLLAGAGINIKDRYGRVPLYYAIGNKNREIVHLLISVGADLNVADNYNVRLLEYAIKVGNAEIVEMLLANGADIDFLSKDGYTPIYLAIKGNNKEIVEILLQYGAKIEIRYLFDAIRMSSIGIAELLIQYGADVNGQTLDGYTPLHQAVQAKDSALVKLLLTHGADPRIPNSKGETPYDLAKEEIKEVFFEYFSRGKDLGEELIRTSEEGDEEYVKWLLERGANVNAATSDGVTTLHIAVREGFIELVRLLLEHGADAEVVDSKGNRPRDLASEEIKEVIFEHYARGKDLGEELIRASEEGDEEYVKWLLERGADVNAATSDGNTALHLAAQKGHTDIVKLLLEYGADPLASNVRGKRAYDLSSNEEIKEILFKHVSKGKDLNIELLEASKGGDLEYAKWLIKKKTNPNITLYDGNTPLHLAAQQGHLNIVKLLLDNGADPLAFNVEGYRAHHLAATNEIKNNLFGYISKEKSLNYELTNACKDGDLEYAKWLIEKGANINTLDYQGFSPLHWAIGKGNFELVELLLKHGADVNLKAADTTTPLHIAVQRNHTQIIDLLLRYGVDVNAVTLDGNTPLHWAAKQNALEIIEVLLNHGADPNVLNSLGVRPHDLINENVREFFFRRFSEGKNLNEELLMASKRGDFEYTKWLLEKGGKTDVFDPEGNTPLHLAAENGHEEVALFLFEQGGDLQAENNRGETPLSVATPEVKSLLLGKALIEALDRRNFFYVKRLIRQGAEVNMKNKMGKAPLHIAVEEKTLDFVEFLLSNRANPNVRDREGNTPLHYAAKEGDRRMVELLLSKGADREIKNYKGQRPYNVARNIYVLVLL